MPSQKIIFMTSILDKLATEVDKIEDSFFGKDKKEDKASKVLKKEDDSLMGKLLSDEKVAFPSVGDVIEGIVIEVSSNALYLDIAPFGTGVVLGREIKDGLGSGRMKLGDKVSATITDLENEDGFIELSIREASFDKAWEDLESKRDTQENVKTKVLSANKGGLLVEVNGISGFLPVSQLSSKNYPRVENGDKNKILGLLKKLVGQEIEVRVLDADKESGKLIVSEKATQKEKDRAIISNLEIGDVVEGEISGVVDFGAFVKFFAPGKTSAELTEEDKLEGLVHISELAWQLIENPRDIVKVGSKIKAQIIGIDNDKISLSIRALEKDPWSELKYKTGDIVKGKVHKINNFGAFVYLNDDIHGLAHISEMTEVYPGKNIKEMLKVGESYDWKILSIEPKEHRMGLLLADKPARNAMDGKSEKKAEKEERSDEPEKKERAEKKPARNASRKEAGGEKAEKPKKEKVEKPKKEKKSKK